MRVFKSVGIQVMMAALAAIVVGPVRASAQGSCPGSTSASLTTTFGDGATPVDVKYNIILDGYGATMLLGNLPPGTSTSHPINGGAIGETLSWSVEVGGGDFFAYPKRSWATCVRPGPEGSCVTKCFGDQSFEMFSSRGSYKGKVVNLPKQVQAYQSVGYEAADAPGITQAGVNTQLDGTFDLGTFKAGHNWLVQLLPSGGGNGSRTYRFWVTNDPVWKVASTVQSNKKQDVLIMAPAPYYEPPPLSPPPCDGGPCDNVGQPVRVTTGEMHLRHSDTTVGSVTLARSYSSKRLTAGRYGIFGLGWNTSLEERLSFPEAGVIESRSADGSPAYFVDSNSDGTYESTQPPDPLTWIETVAGGFKKRHAEGGEEVFTTAGRISSSTDASNIATTFARDGSGKLTGVSRQGRGLTFTYSGSLLQSVQNGATLLATYSYDTSARLDTVAYPDGTGYQFGYDDSNRLIFVGDLSGKMLERHEYDAKGRATTSEIDEGREKFTMVYADQGTTVTDALGNSTLYEFAVAGGSIVITRVTGPCATCGGGGDIQEFEYDERGNLLKRRDAGGKEWVYTYDANRKLVTETNPLNQTTTYTYDAQGRMLTRTRQDGAVTSYVQGASGPTSITQSVTASTTRTTGIAYHTSNGRPVTITDPRGKATMLAYNATTGDLTSVTDPLGHSTTFAYDAFGRRTSVTDALGHATTVAYDIRGMVTRVMNHDGTHTDFTFDKSGRRETVKDPLGRTTRYIYDDLGRLSTVLDPMNQATRYGYDLMGNLLSLTDAKGQTTTFEYDGHFRLKKTTYPGGAFETFTYDVRGRLTSMVDRKGTTTTYAHDDLGRLTGKAFSDGTPAISHGYDVAGRMLTAANGTDTLIWVYNLAGELLSEQSAKNASTVAHQYDDGGNRIEVKLDGTVFVTYGYDDASRLTSIARGANVFGFAYDNANRRTSMSYPNGVNTAYTYDGLNRLTNLAATKASTNTPITNFGYAYDAAGNRTQKSTLDYTEDYGYDPLYRLTRTDRTNPGASPPNQWTWNYDAVGNRTSAQKDSEAMTSSYNEKNQLTGVSGGGKLLWRGTLDEPGIATFHAPTINGRPARMLAGNVFEAMLDLPAGANTVTIQAQDGSGNIATKAYSVNVLGVPSSYTYDASGNLMQKMDGDATWTYTWDALNQLSAVAKNGVTQATYAYDPVGRRIEKNAGATTTRWTYDGDDITRQSATASTVTTITRLIHGAWIDEPLAQEATTTGAMTYLHADGLGSITHHTSAAGVAIETITYDAWGNIQTGSPSPFGFTGREWDAAIQLWYYRARYYDSQQGRFVSGDPIGFAGGVNRYAYVLNSPTGLTDWSGLAPGKRFDTQNEAAMDAYSNIYGKYGARKEGEWGGRICWDACAKKYFATEPVWNPRQPGHIPEAIIGECPKGSKRAGWYHTHPDNDFIMSRQDQDNADGKYTNGIPDGPAYMATGDGDAYRYNAGDGQPPSKPFDTVRDYNNRPSRRK